MGLDMYVYKVRRLNDNEVRKAAVSTYEELSDLYGIVEEGNVDSLEIQDIEPYLRKVDNIPAKIIDFDLIRKENDIPITWKRVGSFYGSGKINFTYSSPKYRKEKSIELTNEELESRFIKIIRQSFYLFKVEQLLYWRKEYNLQDKIYDLYDGQIMNCGYHVLNEAMAEVIAEDCEKRGISIPIDFGENDDEECYCYHEWY